MSQDDHTNLLASHFILQCLPYGWLDWVFSQPSNFKVVKTLPYLNESAKFLTVSSDCSARCGDILLDIPAESEEEHTLIEQDTPCSPILEDRLTLA